MHTTLKGETVVKEGQSILLFSKHCEEGEMGRERGGAIRGMQSRMTVARRREGGRERAMN